MSTVNAIRFHEALEIVESLPGPQRDELVEIVRRRRDDERREALVRSVAVAEEELAKGEVERGTVDDLLRAVDG